MAHGQAEHVCCYRRVGWRHSGKGWTSTGLRESVRRTWSALRQCERAGQIERRDVRVDGGRFGLVLATGKGLTPDLPLELARQVRIALEERARMFAALSEARGALCKEGT